jgi:hypothetical protein
MGSGRTLNVLPYLLLMGIHVLLLLYWRPVVDYLRWWLADSLILYVAHGPTPVSWSYSEATSFSYLVGQLLSLADRPRDLLDAVVFAGAGMTYFANALRLVIAAATLLTFVFRKWIIAFASLVWRRVAEEERKGTFTLLLGGVGGIGGALTELAKHL